MRVLMTGGGTAGHINPALAIAATIRDKWPDAGYPVRGGSGPDGDKARAGGGIPAENGGRARFPAEAQRKKHRTESLRRVPRCDGGGRLRRILRDFRPDIAIGTGGYVCGPILRKAARMGIPVVVHESNAYPGVTVKMLAKMAKAVLICDESARKYLPEDANVIVTGNPLRRDFLLVDREQARRQLGWMNGR